MTPHPIDAFIVTRLHVGVRSSPLHIFFSNDGRKDTISSTLDNQQYDFLYRCVGRYSKEKRNQKRDAKQQSVKHSLLRLPRLTRTAEASGCHQCARPRINAT